MIDAYAHLDMRAPEPLADLGRRLAEAGVEGALVVETWDGRNRAVMETAGMKARPGIGLAYCFRGETEAEIETRLAPDKVRALRIMTKALSPSAFLPALLARSRKWLLPHAEAGIGPLADALSHAAERHPDLQLYVPHLGWPRRDGLDDADWPRAMRRIADIPNAVVGVSALEHFSREAFPHDDVRPFAEQLCALFGPRRILIGSDYPLIDESQYADHMALARSWVIALSPNWSDENALRP